MPSTTSSTALNQAALLTPPGAAAIAVLRLRGPLLTRLLTKHFDREVRIGRCVHGRLIDEHGEIDDPLVVLINSDCVDINLHGGPAIISRVLALAESWGYAICDPGTLSIGKAKSWEETVVKDLPFAMTRLAIESLLAQRDAWTNLAATTDLAAIAQDRSLYWLLNPPTVAIVGAPNVGKSTLANQLFEQSRSIVFDRPGTTRDWVGEFADINGLPVMLIDTPGIRETLDPIEAAAIQQSRTPLKSADLILLLHDVTRPATATDARWAHEFPQRIDVLNKVDLPAERVVCSPDHYRIVARNGEGLDNLRSAIYRFFLGDAFAPDRPRYWTEAQRDRLLRGERLNA